MDCRCESYSCVTVLVNPCTTGTQIPITSPVTGVYTIELEFNGTISLYDISLTTGSQFVLPTSMLNENYIHNLLIEGEAETYCYQLKTKVSYEIEDVPVAEIANTIRIEATAGNTLTDARMFGRFAIVVDAYDLSYTRENAFTQSGSTITMTNGLSFNDGDIIWVELQDSI